MNLYELYNNLLIDEHTFYYNDFKFKGNYLKNATRLLDEYFRHAGKTPLAEFNCYKPDDYEREARNKHMVSTYLLGYFIAEKMNLKDQINIVGTYPFNYVWYLICLFHDAGYGLEKNTDEREILKIAFPRTEAEKVKSSPMKRYKIYGFKKRQNIHSSIWYGHNKFSYNRNRRGIFNQDNVQVEEENIDKEVIISQYYRKHKYVEFADGTKYHYPTYKSELINNYFEYRLFNNENGCIDHGIAGGYIFFDTMIKNYIYCYNEARREYHCNFNDFIYNTKSYRIEQFSVFGYVADCIIAHNIWNGKNDAEDYRRFRLDSLIGDKYKKVSKRNNPYLFLLALSDTLEPLKIFREFNWTDEQLLRQINFDFTDNSLIISSNNYEIYSAYCHKLAGAGDWIDIKVNFNDEKNEIRLTY